MPSTTESAYDRALAYARARGATDGANAAGWYVQDTIGGRVTGDPARAARYILRGIEDGDSAVTDGFPFADLSGQWADTLTGPALVDDARYAAGLQHDERHDLDAESFREACEACRFTADSFADVCDAYELAYNDGAQGEIERAARAIPRAYG